MLRGRGSRFWPQWVLVRLSTGSVGVLSAAFGEEQRPAERPPAPAVLSAAAPLLGVGVVRSVGRAWAAGEGIVRWRTKRNGECSTGESRESPVGAGALPSVTAQIILPFKTSSVLGLGCLESQDRARDSSVSSSAASPVTDLAEVTPLPLDCSLSASLPACVKPCEVPPKGALGKSWAMSVDLCGL